MDIQLISNNLINIQNYVAGYSTKNETSKGNNLLYNMLSKQIDSKDMFKIFINLLSLKDQGVLEMSDFLLGHSFYEFDTGHVFINSNVESKRFRY